MISITAPIVPYFLYKSIEQNFIGFIITGFTCLFCVVISIYLLGLEKHERTVINSKIKAIINKIRK